MTAQVKEVQAFKAIDGEVFDTYIKAHHRNIFVLIGRLLGDMSDFDEGERLHRHLHHRLTDVTGSRNLQPKQAILDLAKELE